MTQQGKNAIDLVLAESLIELSAKKPIDKITIKEITDKAGVIRPTFYSGLSKASCLSPSSHCSMPE